MRKAIVVVLACAVVVASATSLLAAASEDEDSVWRRAQRYLAGLMTPPGSDRPGTSEIDAALRAAFASGAAAPVSGAELSSPAGIARRGGEVIIAEGDGGRVVSVDDGAVETIGEALPRGRFTTGATGVAIDAAGTVYVAAADEGLVRYYPQDGAGGVYAAGLGSPVGIAFSGNGDLLVADAGGKRVLRVGPTRRLSVLAAGFEERPFGLAVDGRGVVFVSTLRDGKVFELARNGDPSLVARVPDGGTAEGLAVDADGGVYVGDGQTGRILHYDADRRAPEVVLEGINAPINLGVSGEHALLVAVQETRFQTDPETGRETTTPEVQGDQVLTVQVETALVNPRTPPLAPSVVPDYGGNQTFAAGGLSLIPDASPAGVEAVDVGHEASEPTLGVTSKGNVFITATSVDSPLNRIENDPSVRASFDRGESFVDRTPNVEGVRTQLLSLDPFLYVDPTTDRVFNVDLGLYCSFLSYSDDEGESWTVNPYACGDPFNDHQSVVAGRPVMTETRGYPNIVYYCYSEGATHTPESLFRNTLCTRSLDGGLTFEPDATIAYPDFDPETGEKCGSLSGHAATGPNGWLYVPRLYCKRPYVAISKDDGRTFERIRVSDDVMPYLLGDGESGGDIDHEAAIALDDAGNAYYAYIGPGWVPRLAISRDGGLTWDEPIVIGPPELAQANLPSIAVGEPGQVAVSFYGTANRCCYLVDPEDPGRRNNSEAYWSTYIVTTRNALSEQPAFFAATAQRRTDPSVKQECIERRFHQCGLALDFLDVVIDDTGEVWSGSVDTCTVEPMEPFTGDCVHDPTTYQNNQRGIVAHLSPPKGGHPIPADRVDRTTGATRVQTAIELSREAFDRADAAVLARSDLFPDALAASGLAGELDAPVLLTPTDGLDDAVGAELERLGVDRVYLMGGVQALSEQVERDLQARGMLRTRVGGAERFATAALVAEQVVASGGPVEQAIVALGARPDGRDAWPDALAAGNLAATARAPILLATPDQLPEPSTTALARLLDDDAPVFVVGGERAVGSAPEQQLRDDGYAVARLAGADRYATAVAVVEEARQQGADVEPTVLASGQLFADALVAGPAAHRLGGVMLLVHPDDLDASPATRDFLGTNASAIDTALLVGGTATIAERVADQVQELITDSS